MAEVSQPPDPLPAPGPSSTAERICTLELELPADHLPRFRRLVLADTAPTGRPAPRRGTLAPRDSGSGQTEPNTPAPRLEARESQHTLAGPDGTTLRLTLLRGHIIAADTMLPVCRITLAGPDAAVLARALDWASDLPLAPPRTGLTELAAALATGQPVPPRSLGSVALADGLSTGDGFSRVVAHLADVIFHWGAAIGPGGEDIEPVHQMRVALRRLRSALAIFRPAVACPATDVINAALRDLARALGPARDWDVFLAGTGQRVANAIPRENASQQAAMARLLRAASRRRDAAYDDLAALRASPDYRQLAIRLVVLAAGRGWQTELPGESRRLLEFPLTEFAAKVLARRYRRMRKAGKGFAELDVASLHEVRLLGKRLRYAAEFFATLFDADAARRFIVRLTRLQDHLGLLNDSSVAAPLLAELGPGDGRLPGGGMGHACGLVLGFIAGEGAHARAELAKCWRRFRRQQPFWE